MSASPSAFDTDLERRLVRATQAGLPVHPRPYDVLAEQLGCDAETIKQAFETMLSDGRVRRIGLVPNHYRLGFTANGMSVWDVDDAEVQEVGRMIGDLEMVSHCYRRPRCLPEWPYNLFAMVHGHHRDEVMEKVAQIREMLGVRVRTHDVLFSTRILKKTGLRIA